MFRVLVAFLAFAIPPCRIGALAGRKKTILSIMPASQLILHHVFCERHSILYVLLILALCGRPSTSIPCLWWYDGCSPSENTRVLLPLFLQRVIIAHLSRPADYAQSYHILFINSAIAFAVASSAAVISKGDGEPKNNPDSGLILSALFF
jgi:hypothetical protein